ncbi:MAG: aspartate aminotransferase family protein [Bacteroidales bacterium]|nr:aspartate aminotransferase family protein [Bacteroidales bacterium]
MTNLTEFRNNVAQIAEIDEIILDPVKADGIWVYTSDGKRYMDLLSGICVGNVGHRNPDVVEAIKKQCGDYLHVMVYGEYMQKPQLDYIKRLKEFLPKDLEQIFYVNSGSEAIEGAIKTAKLYNKRKQIITYKNSYHGSTLGCVSMISDKKYNECFQPLIPMIEHIEFNNEDDLMKITEQTSCVVAETIAVGEGVELPRGAYLKKLRDRCSQVGAVLILDEIQTGFGRSGKLFAFEHYGITPDILCIAKAMGGGLPIGAFIGRKDIMNALNNHHPLIGHATTYGGNPVCLASALATLNFIVTNGLTENAQKMGLIYRSKLRHRNIKEVRGEGLFNCIELREGVSWQEALKSCFRHGLITGTHLFNPMCLSIKPPLIITEEEVCDSIERLLAALDEL